MRACKSLLIAGLLSSLACWSAFAAPPVKTSGTASSANTENPGTQLHWVSSNLPPFGWVDERGPQGYAYELVALMSAKLGRSAELPFYPWARAIRMVQDANGGKEAYGTFPVSRSPERESQFRWLILLSHGRYAFFARAGSTVDVNDLDALSRLHVGVLRGSPLFASLKARKFQYLVEAQDYKDMLRLLSQGIVDAVVSTESVLRAAMDEYAFKAKDFRSGGDLGGADLYLATSTNLDPAEGERWLKAYRELKQDGNVARLQKKYLH